MEEGNGRNTGSPGWWRGTRQPTAREGQVGPARVAERPILPVKPGNAGGGKGPQVRSDAQREQGSREWPCLLPRMMTRKPGSITCPSEGTALERRGVCRGVNWLGGPLKAPCVAGRKSVPLSQDPITCWASGCQGVPCARRMIPLESRDAVNPPAPVVCPAKADTFSGSQSRQGKSQSLVARMAGRRETESLKPIDKAIFGMAASHRAVVQTNTDVARKVRGISGGRACNRKAKTT